MPRAHLSSTLLVVILVGLGARCGAVEQHFVQVLTFEVAPEWQEDFLQNDHEVWTTVQAQAPGFLGKQSWVSLKNPEQISLVIHWEKESDSKAIPKQEFAAAGREFGNAMGGSKKYRLIEKREYTQRRWFVPE